MKNIGKDKVKVELGEIGAEYLDVFGLAYETRELEQGEEVTVKVEFSPRTEQAYEIQVPVYVDGDLSKPYLSVDVAGSGRFPRLLFDREEVFMPPVPIGVTSEAQVR